MYGGGFFLQGIDSANSDSHSKAADFFFQVVFVATAMSIVSGAVAERMRLFSFFLFAIIFTGVIYPIEGSWTWNGEPVFQLFKLSDYHFEDFAGSGIVHIAVAAAALAGVLVLGPRRGKYNEDGSSNAILGANMPLATLGTFILWMGWLGFNGGSMLSIAEKSNANAVAMVFLNTNLAAGGGVIASLLLVKFIWGRADLTIILNGALAGLVSITAGPLRQQLLKPSSLVPLYLFFSSTSLINDLRLMTLVGAISVHGVAGLWGLLIVSYTNEKVSLLGQCLGALTIFIWVFCSSLLLWLLIKNLIGVRVSKQHENEGVDISECGIEAYPKFHKKL